MRQPCLTFLMVLTLIASATAQKVLHVSTIPSNADVYIEEIHPDLADKPDYRSPAFVPISEEQNVQGEILLHLFHQDFYDTTIRVKLSDKDTSYLIVSLRPTYDQVVQDEQERIMAKRSRRNFGHNLMFASIVPFVVSGAAGLVTLYQIEQAKDAKDKINNTYIKDPESLQKNSDDFNDAKDKAKIARTTTFTSLIIGASALVIGFTLSF